MVQPPVDTKGAEVIQPAVDSNGVIKTKTDGEHLFFRGVSSGPACMITAEQQQEVCKTQFLIKHFDV